MLRAFLHSSNVLRAHLVLFAVLVGISPLLRVDSSSSLINSEKRGGAVPADIEAVLCGRLELALALVVELEEELPCRAERQVHSHMPRLEGE